MADWIGRTLSKVEIEKLLGRGGMAEVFLGRHTTLNRPVAVKILHAHLSEDDSLLGRFTAEAQAVATMRHPNIVQVFDFDVVDDRPYIVMELLEGVSLANYLKALHQQGRTIPPETAAHLIEALASALDYAHERGIVHRDIKPANIMLRRESGPLDPSAPLPHDVQPVLTDFGVARMAHSVKRTASGVIIGTPAYMSPEQVQGEVVDARSDIYSLGIVLYEMLAGAPPFDSETETPASILVKHLTDTPPPVPNIGLPVQRVLDKALAKDRDRRYQTTREMAADLQAALAGVDTAPMDTPFIGQEAAPAVPRSPVGSSPTDLAAPARPGVKPLWIVGGVGALAALIGVVLLLAGAFGGKAQATPEPPQPAGAAAQQADAPSPTEEAVVETASQATPTALAAPEELAPGASPTEDTTTPRGVVLFRGASLAAALHDLEPLPDGFVYEAWLIGPEVEPLSLGLVETTDGEASLIFDDPSGAALLGRFDGFVVTLEPDPGPPAMSDGRVYAAQIKPETLSRLVVFNDVWRGAPLSPTLLDGLLMQAHHFSSHLGFALDGLNANNLPEAQVHAEHTINIIVGRESADYGDWNGDGRTENPGDEVGLLPYLLILSDAMGAAAAAPDADAATRETAGAAQTAIERAALDVNDALRLFQRIAAADAIEEALPLGEQLRAFTIFEQVEGIAQQAQGIDLAISAEVFAVRP